MGSISAALSCLVYPPREETAGPVSGKPCLWRKFMKVDLGQNVRLVVSVWRFFVSSFRYGVSAFRHTDTPCRLAVFWGRLGEIPVRFVGWSRLSFHRFVVSSCRFVVSLCRFVVSTRPLREAIIRVHYMKCLPDSMHLYMTRLFIICSVMTENVANRYFEELPTAQHRIRVKSSEWAV